MAGKKDEATDTNPSGWQSVNKDYSLRSEATDMAKAQAEVFNTDRRGGSNADKLKAEKNWYGTIRRGGY